MKVVKIGAVWCAGCIVMKPIWRDIEVANPWLETTSYDIDDDEEIVQAYGDLRKLPIFIFFGKNGKEIARFHGEISRSEFLKKIDPLKNL
ncbi:MAG: thioredoxin family protein [Candidatus Gracilibacteria bacterium]